MEPLVLWWKGFFSLPASLSALYTCSVDVDEYTTRLAFRPVEKQTQAINFAVDIYPFLPVLGMRST